MPLELQEFNLSEERLEFRDTLRRFFEESSPITEVRRVMEDDSTGFAPNTGVAPVDFLTQSSQKAFQSST